MITISKVFNEVCKQKYQPMGFVKCKKVFARKIGDVVHTFGLKLSRLGPFCTVVFGVEPMCLSHEIHLNGGIYELDKFFDNVDIGGNGWMFDSRSEESINNCVQSIIEAIDTYLMPLFEKCVDTKSALPELIKLDELFDNNRKSVLKKNCWPDLAKPWQERSLCDYRKSYMAMKIHDWAYVKKYLNHVGEEELCDLLYAEYYEYFDDIVKSNEENNLKFLADNYPKLLK